MLAAEEFIERAKLKHGNYYDYSKVKYINTKTKVEIICPIHGAFWQTPEHHFKHGCKKCADKNNGLKRKRTTDEFIAEAKIIHGDRYDYSKAKYIDYKTKVEIICPIHGSFFQNPTSHLLGYGCQKCVSSTTDEFIAKAKLIHGNRYDYSKVDYISANSKVEIICPIHGAFWQRPNDHLAGCGCSNCHSSKGEEKIARFLESKGILFERQKKFNDLSDKHLLSFDFYLPKENILIEYNGIQHYSFNPFFHKNLHDFHKQKHHDWLKRKYCLEHNFDLIVIKGKNLC